MEPVTDGIPSLKCIIVDDEPLARRGLRRLAERSDMLRVVGSAGCVAEAEAILEEQGGVELVFLDIDMPGESGLELARRLVGKSMVVFTTAYTAFALDSYEVDAIDYLLKPIQAERFAKAVEKAYRLKYADNAPVVAPATISVKADRKFVIIAIDEIMYVEGMKDYLVIYLKEKPRVVTRMTMKSLEDLLPASAFLRVNKSFIVNMRMVEAYDTANVVLQGGVEVPIGKVYREVALSRLGEV